MFGSSNFGNKSLFGGASTTTTTSTANDDILVDSPPDDTVQALKFSPPGSEKPMLAAGSWDGVVRVWMLNENGQCEPKAQQQIPAPVLDIDWTEDGARIFIAAADKDVRLWDLASNQVAVVGSHNAPVRTCHWIKAPSYSCLMTGSWDKTLRFWDMRNLPQQTQMACIELPERVYAADVVYPMAAVVLANKTVKVYNLEQLMKEEKITIIQKHWRSYKARQIYRELILSRNQKLKEHEAILLIQSAFRRYLAIKNLQNLISEKNRQLEIEISVIGVQSKIRAFLARKRMNEIAAKELEDLEGSTTVNGEALPATPPPYRRYSMLMPPVNASTPELLMTLRKLRQEVTQIKKFNTKCETVLDRISLHSFNESTEKETESSEDIEANAAFLIQRCWRGYSLRKNMKGDIKMNLDASLQSFSSELMEMKLETPEESAARLLQRSWRGYSSRRKMQEDIDKRMKAMDDYKQNIAIVDASYDTKEQKRSVYEKLNEWTDWLFDKSLFRTKVAAISIDRVCQLADIVARYFIFDCNGLTAVLDRMEQTDRSPGEEEIMMSLTCLLSRIIEKASVDSKINEIVLRYKNDCMKILFHFINAYHGNSIIVLTSAKAAKALKSLSDDVGYEKAKFFINQAEKRYKRLSQCDPKSAALKILQENFQ